MSKLSPTSSSRHRTISCALITGASAGLGEEFALQLAPRVDHLVLVARREARLQLLAEKLRNQHPGLSASVIAADLTNESERTALVQQLSDSGTLPDLLINNAGLGDYGEFASAEWSRLDAMLKLNIAALTHLTHALVPHMLSTGRGGIINVSSLASLLPIPDFAVYAASKAYVTSFSEALRIELKAHRIPVLALCPGPVKTEFSQVARRTPDAPGMPTQTWMLVDRQRVVADALIALKRQVPRAYPGFPIMLAALVLSTLPFGLIRLAIHRRSRRLSA